MIEKGDRCESEENDDTLKRKTILIHNRNHLHLYSGYLQIRAATYKLCRSGI
jgi:hypothetical protein